MLFSFQHLRQKKKNELPQCPFHFFSGYSLAVHLHTPSSPHTKATLLVRLLWVSLATTSSAVGFLTFTTSFLIMTDRDWPVGCPQWEPCSASSLLPCWGLGFTCRMTMAMISCWGWQCWDSQRPGSRYCPPAHHTAPMPHTGPPANSIPCTKKYYIVFANRYLWES